MRNPHELIFRRSSGSFPTCTSRKGSAAQASRPRAGSRAENDDSSEMRGRSAHRLTASTLLALVLAAGAVPAAPTVVRVTHVKDGDSLIAESPRAGGGDPPRGHRCAGVRPGLRQAGESGAALPGRRAPGRDRSGRPRCVPAHRRVDVGRSSRRERGDGAARLSHGHAGRPGPVPRLIRLEEQAKAARRGLWARADPVAPWTWRKAKRRDKRKSAAQPKRSARSSAVPKVTCGTRRYCRDMRSCKRGARIPAPVRSAPHRRGPRRDPVRAGGSAGSPRRRTLLCPAAGACSQAGHGDGSPRRRAGDVAAPRHRSRSQPR